MATEKLKFVLELYSEFFKNPPKVEILVNDNSKQTKLITGTKAKPDVIEFEHEFNEGEKIELKLSRTNKTSKDTIFKDGKILGDQLLHIKTIVIDDIEIGALVFEGVYTPEYPEPWATQQAEAGKKLPKSFTNCTILGHNGTWTLTAQSPLYMWLLENLY